MAKKQSRLARIKQLAAADAGRKAKRAKAQPVIVQIEGDASPALKAAMLKTIAAHVVSWHDVHELVDAIEANRPKRGSYKRRK